MEWRKLPPHRKRAKKGCASFTRPRRAKYGTSCKPFRATKKRGVCVRAEVRERTECSFLFDLAPVSTPLTLACWRGFLCNHRPDDWKSWRYEVVLAVPDPDGRLYGTGLTWSEGEGPPVFAQVGTCTNNMYVCQAELMSANSLGEGAAALREAWQS